MAPRYPRRVGWLRATAADAALELVVHPANEFAHFALDVDRGQLKIGGGGEYDHDAAVAAGDRLLAIPTGLPEGRAYAGSLVIGRSAWRTKAVWRGFHGAFPRWSAEAGRWIRRGQGQRDADSFLSTNRIFQASPPVRGDSIKLHN